MKRDNSFVSGTRGPQTNRDSLDKFDGASSSINRTSMIEDSAKIQNFFNPEDKQAIDFYKSSGEKSSMKQKLKMRLSNLQRDKSSKSIPPDTRHEPIVIEPFSKA